MKSRHALPSGSCNAHCHVFGPRNRFAYAPNASFVPDVDAPREELYALNDRLGFQRCVVVQSTCHGFDNSAMLDALIGRPGQYRGIVLVPTDVADKDLRAMDDAGVRGVRFNYMGHLGHATPIEDVLALAKRFEPLGWHLQLHGDPGMLKSLTPAIADAPVPVVIDHIGRIDASLGVEHPDFQVLRHLLDLPHVWMKVSGMDRITRQGPPYTDALRFAQLLVEQQGDRVLWGNDWPHPNHAGPTPDEEQLVSLIQELAPTDNAIRRLLVDNPQRLYRFGELL